MGDCKNNDCEADNSVYNDDDDLATNAWKDCCYNIVDKTREFLHSDTYILEYKNIKNSEEVADRLKVFYSKFFQSYNVVPTEKINGRYNGAGKNSVDTKYLNGKYFDIFGIIPIELVPASYIPFNYKNYEMNLDRLSQGDIFTEDDYKRVLLDYKKLPDPDNKTTYITDKDLKGYLEYCLKDLLNNPKSTFNAYSISILTSWVVVLWMLIIGTMLNVLFYYYRDIYSYILLFITILLILAAVIWKMIYILNLD